MPNVKNTPVMHTESQNAHLCALAGQGDESAKEQLLSQNEGMLRYVVRQEMRRYHYLTLETEDLLEAARVGLLRAAREYSGAGGRKFAALAWVCVPRAVRREIAAGGTLIVLPERRYYQKPKESQIAPSRQSVPIDLLQGERLEWQSVPVRDTLTSPDEFVENKLALAAAMHRLTQKERTVITMHYGLDGGTPCTYAEIGQAFGLTRSRVHQIERKALQKMRRYFLGV